MKKLIVYEGDGEVLVCNPADEKYLLTEWFEKGRREVEVYTRTEIKGVLEVTTNLKMFIRRS